MRKQNQFGTQNKLYKKAKGCFKNNIESGGIEGEEG